MTRLHRLHPLSALALTATLLLPAGTAMAQDDAVASGGPDAAAAEQDPRLTELVALLPAELAGVSLADNLTLATGEQLLALMRPEEAAIIEGVLDVGGRTVADYAAATTWLPVAATDVVVLQAHRIAGIDASATVDAWVEVLTVNLADPQVSEGMVAGRPVTLVSDAGAPEVPTLHLFPVDDVTWMIVAADQAIVEEAMAAVGSAGPTEGSPEASTDPSTEG
ncbi:MAG: hypothetical protein R6W93_01535 [Candidatus Limnocylindrales bacterium]